LTVPRALTVPPAGADGLGAAAGGLPTAADALLTAADALLTAADALLTAADAVLTAADAVGAFGMARAMTVRHAATMGGVGLTGRISRASRTPAQRDGRASTGQRRKQPGRCLNSGNYVPL
jgi:hypothetical protein